MNETQERREFARIPAAAIVEIAPADETEKGVSVETLDMSAGGILFSSDRAFETGSRWKLILRLDESIKLNPNWNAEHRARFRNIHTLCEIVRAKGSDEIGFDVAARFVQIDENDAEAVKSFLAEL